MTKTDFREKFVAILLAYEGRLSDGFIYYSDERTQESAVETLNDVADELFESLGIYDEK